jgi:hypothetical protein
LTKILFKQPLPPVMPIACFPLEQDSVPAHMRFHPYGATFAKVMLE